MRGCTLVTQMKQVNLSLGATETTETDLGDIKVPPNASRITGVCAACALETGTAAEGCLGRARIDFSGCEELDGIPADVVCIIDVGQVPYVPEFIPVNIAVVAGSLIACYMTLTLAQTGNCHGQVALRFE